MIQLAARLTVRLRHVLVLLWIAVAAASFLYLPTIREAQTGSLGDLVPDDAEAYDAELRSKTEFGFPLLSRTVLVERSPSGLTAAQQAQVVRRAVALNRDQLPGLEGIAGALTVTNAVGASPFARERSTTALTYLFFPPEIGQVGRTGLAERLRDRHGLQGPDVFSGVTGTVVARGIQAELTLDALPLVELATVLLVALVVAFHFRAVGAAVLNLAGVAIAYLVATRVMSWSAERVGISVPSELEPIVVVLVFGVLTDYSIFFLSRYRRRLREGEDARSAAEHTHAELLPIVGTAGLTVAAGTSALSVAQLGFFRAFGPGMAIAVLVAVAVALTFIPAGLAWGGRRVFWPKRPKPDLLGREPRIPLTVRFATRRPVLAIVCSLAVLLGLAAGLLRLDVGNPVIRGLPEDADPHQAYTHASRGFAPGVLAPTLVVVEGEGVTARRGGLARLQRLLERQEGVAQVVGPRQQPLGRPLGGALSRDGDAARYVLVMRDDPLGSGAIEDVSRLKDELPSLLARAGLPEATAGVAGDTALVAETIEKTVSDLARIAPAAVLAVFLVVALFLRAVVAPLYLVAASTLGLSAALGATAFFFDEVVQYGELSYFVPFATAVLLLSLGSDYSVFLIGRIWHEARTRPFREAIVVGAARSTRPIAVAAIVLGLSFALLVIVPVRAFREFAFAMGVGLLLDAFVVRTLLLPALIALFGQASSWPRRKLLRVPAPEAG